MKKIWVILLTTFMFLLYLVTSNIVVAQERIKLLDKSNIKNLIQEINNIEEYFCENNIQKDNKKDFKKRIDKVFDNTQDKRFKTIILFHDLIRKYLWEEISKIIVDNPNLFFNSFCTYLTQKKPEPLLNANNKDKKGHLVVWGDNELNHLLWEWITIPKNVDNTYLEKEDIDKLKSWFLSLKDTMPEEQYLNFLTLQSSSKEPNIQRITQEELKNLGY